MTTLLRDTGKPPSIQQLQRDVASLDERQRDIVRRSIINSLDSGIHDFLFNLVLESDNRGRVQMTVDGVNMVEVSDGLQGEPYGNRGWIATYSAYSD